MKLRDWWKVLKLKLMEHYHYYGISGNMSKLKAYYGQVAKLAYKWINRRSQKRSYNGHRFYRFLKYNPLPKPKIYHLTYTSSLRRGYITEDLQAANLYVRFCEGH